MLQPIPNSLATFVAPVSCRYGTPAINIQSLSFVIFNDALIILLIASILLSACSAIANKLSLLNMLISVSSSFVFTSTIS